MATVLVWSIAAFAIAGILFRPKDWPEAVWACSGAFLMVACRLLPLPQATRAISKGTDVYLFLTGMMLLSELARQQGVFDWLASFAVVAAKGSPARLFTLTYIVGVVVTVFLSNDATAVVLTPAVFAAVHKAQTKTLPYLFICAFIANAASFVLPISNPANLVVYANHLPPLVLWLQTFLVPSICSVVTTYLALRWIFRHELTGKVIGKSEPVLLSSKGRVAAWSIAATTAILLCASGLGANLGFPTLAAALVAVVITTRGEPRALKTIIQGVSWSVLPLVAGLFVLTEALNGVGVLQKLNHLLQWCATLPRSSGSLAVSFGSAFLSNIANNLPFGLLARGALQAMDAPSNLRDAVLIGVDLGPNLSVTGSLATILWLIALRREGEHVSGWQFLKVGLVVMPPALLIATLAISLGSL